jgi:hypothetical protein
MLSYTAKQCSSRPLPPVEKTNRRVGFIIRNEKIRVLARLCDDPGGGVAALRRTTGEKAKHRQVPEILVS